MGQNNTQQAVTFGLALRSRPPFTGVLLGPGPGSAPRSAFRAILGTCLGVPQRVLFECFLAFFGPKNVKKHSKSTLWGTPRQVPKIAQKALRGALPGPGPKSTPVNGGRDRKPCNTGVLPESGFGIPIAWYKARIPGSPRRSIRKGASSVVGWGPESLKMSLALGNPKVAPVQVWIAPEQETFGGLSSPRPKRLLLSIFGEILEFGACTRQSGSQSQTCLCFSAYCCGKSFYEKTSQRTIKVLQSVCISKK